MNDALRCASLIVAIGAVGSAIADDLEAGLRFCATDADDAHRLACYDRLSAAIPAARLAPVAPVASAAPVAPTAPTAPAAPAVPATTAAQIAPAASPPLSGDRQGSIPGRPSGVSDFGVSEGPLGAKRRADKPQGMSAVVIKVGVRTRGELVVTLDNGQVWTQIQAADYFPLKPGDAVTISTGALGSYVLEAPSRRATKVTRIE